MTTKEYGILPSRELRERFELGTSDIELATIKGLKLLGKPKISPFW